MSETVDVINDEFDEFQEELILRSKKLKTLVGFSYDYDELISLLVDIRDSDLLL